MALPTLTPEQRTAALAKAAESRKAQAELLGRLKAGNVGLGKVLATEDPVVGKIRVKRALQALPGVGPAKAASAMEEAKVAANRRISGLTPGQRDRLLALFAG